MTAPLNSTIHGTEILYQTTLPMGTSQTDNDTICFETMLVSLCTRIDRQIQSIIFLAIIKQ